MSIHKSLFIGGALKKDRSVWTRRERLDHLLEEGSWTEEDSVHGLPKVRTKFKVLTKKQKKAQEAQAQQVASSDEGAATDASPEAAE